MKVWKLFTSATPIKAIKMIKLNHLMGFSMRLDKPAKKCRVAMPAASGSTNTSKTVCRMSLKSMENVWSRDSASGNNPDQKWKLMGVKMGQSTVATPVRVTDKAILAPEIEAIKLDTLPPGQAATRIMPKAIAGCGWIRYTSSAVMAGSIRN